MYRILHDQELFRSQCLINGHWRDAADKSVIEVINPANGKQLGTVPNCGEAETREAIEAAQAAFAVWSARTPLERGALLHAWERAIAENIEDLARLLTLEEGKPLAEARAEILHGASYFPWFAEEARRFSGEVTPVYRHGVQALTRHAPVGVAAGHHAVELPHVHDPTQGGPCAGRRAAPWWSNPASATPYSALAMAELAVRVGIPAGVFNVVTGSARRIGNEITANPLVRKLSFTGSTTVGLQLATQCGPTLKRISMELGGNAPFIVFDDADMDKAVTMAMACKFRNAGQTCICANRFLVQSGVVETFATNLLDHISDMRVGDGLKPETDMGPLINADAVAHTDALVKDAVEKGAQLLFGGKPHSLGGNFYEPTLLLGLTPQMRIFREEIFGPVAALMTFDDEEEAISLANDTEFGLASYVCTRDMPRIWRLFNKLQYGMAGFNDAGLAAAETPFGGVKFSGIGRERQPRRPSGIHGNPTMPCWAG
jgi:NAD-dependent aldehyde dehydrogenases